MATCPAADPVVDEVEVEHAVLNLVTNARDAIAGRGAIEIEVRAVQLDDDFVTRHEGKPVGRCARVSISDSGVGIPEAMQAQVFEPFFTTKSVGRGTGLGLATVRSLVEQQRQWGESSNVSDLDANTPCIEKPFTRAALAEKLQETLTIRR